MVLSTLENDGHIMICGSLAMVEGVRRNIKTILTEHELSYDTFAGQIVSDCY